MQEIVISEPDLQMMEPGYLERFGGMARLYGMSGLERLKAAHVAIIGVGGVGSWTVEALARSGVGALTLIDLDDVCITNINRQLPALTQTIGQPKVQVLAERVTTINPGCRVTPVFEFLSSSNVDRLLAGPFSVVVDAVDRMSIKALILEACRQRQMPVVCSGAAGGRRDPTCVKIADLGFAGGDPLLGQVRRQLRRDHGWVGGKNGGPQTMDVPCVFSTERAVYPTADGGCSSEPEVGSEAGLRLDCAGGFGAATFVTGTFGFAIAGWVVQKIVGAAEI